MGNKSCAYRYKEVAVQTANPLQLVVMLYDAAILSIQDARKHIRNKNIGARSQALNRSISIISELQCCLNRKEGGEIALSLDRLYNYMKHRLFRANVDQSVQPLDEIEGLLDDLRSAWKELVDKSLQTGPPAPEITMGKGNLLGNNNYGSMELSRLNISI